MTDSNAGYMAGAGASFGRSEEVDRGSSTRWRIDQVATQKMI